MRSLRHALVSTLSRYLRLGNSRLEALTTIARASHDYRRKSSFRTCLAGLRDWIACHPEKVEALWREIWSRPTAPLNQLSRVASAESPYMSHPFEYATHFSHFVSRQKIRPNIA